MNGGQCDFRGLFEQRTGTGLSLAWLGRALESSIFTVNNLGIFIYIQNKLFVLVLFP